MTWLLLIQVVIVTTCADGFRFCPPPKPPVESRQVLATQDACEARAQHYRRHFPARRTLVQSAHVTMEQQTTISCTPQGTLEGGRR